MDEDMSEDISEDIIDDMPRNKDITDDISMEHLNTPYMQLLFDDIPHPMRQNIIRHSSLEQCKGVLELVYNLIYGNIAVTEKEIKQLRVHKRTLDILVKDSVPIARKQKILTRSYKLLMLVLSILGPWVHRNIFGNE